MGESKSPKLAADPDAHTPLLPSSVHDTNYQIKGAADGDSSDGQCHHQQHDDDHHHSSGLAGGSTLGAVFNLSNTIIGAGIMGLPGTFKILGIPLGLTTLVLVGIISEFALQRLLHATTAAAAWSYGDLMAEACGPWGRPLLRAVIIVHNIGILVVYFIIVGDVLSGSNDGGLHYPGLFEEWAGGPQWWTERTAVLLSCTLLCIMPLVLMKHMDSLRHSSLLSILLAVIFVAITITVTVYNLVKGEINWDDLKWLPSFESARDTWQLFSIIPTMATAFACHYNMHPILVELQPPREPKMSLAMRLTLMLCTAVYCVTALFGYMLFGSDTSSDVLANFDKDLGVPFSAVINDVVRFFYAVHLLLVFPVIYYSLRSSCDAVLFPHAPPLLQSNVRFLFITIALVATILGLSILVPDIHIAFQFVGSTGAATIALTFPGMIALSEKAGGLELTAFQKTLSWGLVLLGIFVTISGLSNNIYSFFT